MSIDYTSLKTMLLAALVRSQPPLTVTEGFFDTLYPQAIQYAQQRIETDLVLVATRVQNSLQLSTLPGSRYIDTSATGIISVENFALFVPERIPYDESTLEAIDVLWPGSLPWMEKPTLNDWTLRLWAMRDDHTIVFMPTADDVYPVVATGRIRLTPPASGTDTNYIMTVYPALYEAACMVFLTGALLHNFGAAGDNPTRAMSWEAVYQSLKGPALHEEHRRSEPSPGDPPPAPAMPAAA